MPTQLQLRRQRKLENEREKAQTNLFYLSQQLGYDLMSAEFHKPIFEFFDKHIDHRRVAFFSSRKSYKSRFEIVEIVQEILRNPDVKILLLHNNLRLANELVIECAELFIKNKWLRTMLPEGMRPPTGKAGENWIKRTDGGEFTMPGIASKASPTLRGASSKQGWTGAHPDIIYLDDIIHDETVEHLGGVDNVRDWIKHTIIPLVLDTGKLRVKGTFWSHDDWYQDLMKQRNRGEDGEAGTGEHSWKYQVRAILESPVDEEYREGRAAKGFHADESQLAQPNWHGEPIKIYVREGKKARRFKTMDDVYEHMDEMGSHFAGQMMNDPRRDGSLPWSAKCRRTCTFAEIKQYIRSVVLTMDPAPLGMTLDGTKLKRRKGKKDDWSIAIIAFCRFPNINAPVRVLLDGAFSDDWGTPDAMEIAAGLIRKWRVELAGVEEGSASMEHECYFGRALQTELDKNVLTRDYVKIVKLKGRQQGKPRRILDLCAGAERGRFLLNIDEDMDKEFLNEFLHQVSQWSGKNSIPKDDVLDAVAYCDDPAIHEEISLGPVTVREDPYTKQPQRRPPQGRQFRHL